MSGYRPISCALHSELELAIMRRQPVTLYRKSAGDLAGFLPLDLRVRDGAEFLSGHLCGVAMEIRLDDIQGVGTA